MATHCRRHLPPAAQLVAEGLPTEPFSGENLIGYGYLTLIVAALAYRLWFRGISALPVGSITFLSLLSPVVAVVSGWVVLHQVLSGWQVAGVAIVLGAVLVVTLHPAPAPGPSQAVLRRTPSTLQGRPELPSGAACR